MGGTLITDRDPPREAHRLLRYIRTNHPVLFRDVMFCTLDTAQRGETSHTTGCAAVFFKAIVALAMSGFAQKPTLRTIANVA